VNGRSQVGAANDVSSPQRRAAAVKQAGKPAVDENQSNVTEGSRRYEKAVVPNERRHHLVKFEVKLVVYRQVRIQKSGCRSRVLKVGKACAVKQLEQ
jgi:hypothetical protein